MKKKIKQVSEVRINIRVPADEKAELKRVSQQSRISETLIVRHAVKKTLPEILRQIEVGKGVAIVL